MSITQSCLTLCDPLDCSLPGSFVHGILQARILEWIALPFSRWSSQPRDQTQLSCIAGRLFTIWATKEALSNIYIKDLYIYIYIYEVKWSESCSFVSDSLQLHGLYSPWNSLGKNTGVGCHFLLQRIFPTQGSNPALLHCRKILHCLSHWGRSILFLMEGGDLPTSKDPMKDG